MAARYPRCAVLMWLHGVVRRRYVAAMVRCEEESGRVNVQYPTESITVVHRVCMIPCGIALQTNYQNVRIMENIVVSPPHLTCSPSGSLWKHPIPWIILLQCRLYPLAILNASSVSLLANQHSSFIKSSKLMSTYHCDTVCTMYLYFTTITCSNRSISSYFLLLNYTQHISTTYINCKQAMCCQFHNVTAENSWDKIHFLPYNPDSI